MRGHLLRHFQLAAILQVRGNSGCAERVAPDQSPYSRASGAAPDHEVDLRLRDAPFGELLRQTIVHGRNYASLEQANPSRVPRSSPKGRQRRIGAFVFNSALFSSAVRDA